MKDRATRGILTIFSLALGLLGSVAVAAEPSAISDVSISRPFFNPTLGQKIGISFNLGAPGTLAVLILDRDGYPVRRLVSAKDVEKGKSSFDWDGRDDAGEVVPDEAYSLKIDLRSGEKVESYFPAKSPAKELGIKDAYYDRRGAVLAYNLPFAARVHLQAGTAAPPDPKTHEAGGPVLRTVVNREPRPAGSVIENWNGYDDGATIYVPDLPHFVIAIAITSLPENAILTSGKRSETFLARAASRKGQSLLPD
jgi:hypothetical protein